MKSDIEQIYKQFAGNVFRYAMFKLQNKAEAEDVTAETFARVLENKKLESIDTSHTESWLIGIARNIVYEKYRKMSKSVDFDATEEVVEGDVDIETEVIEAELLEEIKEGLESLDELTKEIIVLKIWEGLKFEQIAEITDQGIGKVKMRYYRGIKELEEKLKKNKKLRSIALPLILGGVYQISQGGEFQATSQFLARLAGGQSLIVNNSNMLDKLAHALGKLGLSHGVAKAVIITVGGAIVVLPAVAAFVVLNQNPNAKPVDDGGNGTSSTSTTTTTETSTSSSTTTSEEPATKSFSREVNILPVSDLRARITGEAGLTDQVSFPDPGALKVKGSNYELAFRLHYENEGPFKYNDYTAVTPATVRNLGRARTFTETSWYYTDDMNGGNCEVVFGPNVGDVIPSPCGAGIISLNNQIMLEVHCTGEVAKCDEVMRTVKIVKL